TFEPAHVDGYVDPPNCRRAREGQTLLAMILAGEVDAAIGLDPHPSLRPVLPDALAAEADFSHQTGVTPINHVVAARADLVQQQPWLTSELFLLFQPARERALAEGSPAAAAYGLEPNRRAIEFLARYAHEQAITPQALRAEDLFEVF